MSDSATQSLVLPDQVLSPHLFILPVNSPIVFPTMLAPLTVSEPKWIAVAEEALNRQRTLGLLLTKEGDVTNQTKWADLYSTGVMVKILKRLRMPDGSINLLVHSVKRFRATRLLSDHPYLVAEAEYLEDQVEKSMEMDALVRTAVSQVKKLADSNPFFTEEMRVALINAPSPGTVADLVGFAMSLPKAEAQDFLETLSVKSRFEKLLLHLRREQQLADVQRKITEDVDTKVTQMQREFFLREQMKIIRRELGEEESGREKSTRTLRERIEAAGMPEDAKKIALEELSKFETLSETSPEYNIARNYLELLASLPWSVQTTDQLDLNRAREILDKDHYGLEKVKDRIIEFLAVRKLTATPKGSVICLVGPPGVGKTSIGKSIAQTLGRNFFRFSLGGMRDEAEIKGHRRTYIGAMPGKLIQGLKRAGSKNAVLMLDEIDKLGQSFQGDPASALLEVLDPEQNVAFLDHYLDVPFDLSQVLFITTANTTASIPAPLLDRMEIIEIPGYTLEEKEDIARRFVIPKELKLAGLRSSQLKFDRSALRLLISDYSREAGLRSLSQLIQRIARKTAARWIQTKRDWNQGPIRVTEDSLYDWVGPKRFFNETADQQSIPGVVTGLAWTAFGGDILFIEATDLPGTGQLKLTGKMGDVMSESAQIAWSYVKKHAAHELGLKPDAFIKEYKDRDVHLHIPAGAIPKDGPSAGITMATALYSLLTGKVVHSRLAMTGELSLVGKVLPVGGIKEKILAARRSGIKTLILPELNRKDIPEVPKAALQGMTLHFVSRIDEVFRLALESPKIAKRKPKIVRVARVIKSTAKVKAKLKGKRKTSSPDKRSRLS